MRTPFDEIRRQQERINELLGPSRRLQEEILRSYTPIQELERSLRAVTDGLVAKGVSEDFLRSMEMIGRVELQDFSHVADLIAMQRDSLKVADAIKQQTLWIEEASRFTTDASERLLRAGAFAAIEKLAAGQSALLDAERWLLPRPISSALTDVLYAGRSAWALSLPGMNVDAASLDHLARISEEVISALAVGDADEVIDVPPDAATAGGESVSALLLERSLAPPGVTRPATTTRPAGGEAIDAVKTISQAIRFVETRAAKLPLGGFAGWAMGAGLEIVDDRRSAEDRFDSAVATLHDVFVDGVWNADQALAAMVPTFLKRTVAGLRNKSSAHAVEAAVRSERIATNLRERERLFESIGCAVPITEDEWAEALVLLLRRAAEAAVEFRNAIAPKRSGESV